MVVLHCTRKLLARLGSGAGGGTPVSATSDLTLAGSTSTTHLGDWYANLMIVARRPLVLCAAERSLFAVVVPLAEARTLVPRWRQAVERRLLAIGIAPARVSEELAAMAEVRVTSASYGGPGRTQGGESAEERRTRPPSVGRRMVGVLTEMAWQCEAQGIAADRAGEPDVAAMEAALDRLPCTPLDYRRPAEATRDLFARQR